MRFGSEVFDSTWFCVDLNDLIYFAFDCLDGCGMKRSTQEGWTEIGLLWTLRALMGL